ncbi:MAG: (2Fe-2S)-binding protein [Planctomycetes bacterium]|nr:(2Fe-2S)-binding protein [Planctomycetota bacterium]
MELDDPLCYCFHITKRKIVNYIRIQQPRRASQLSECGGAGTGCGWCVHYLKRFFEQSANRVLDECDSLASSDYALQRAEYITSGRGRPAPGAIPLPQESSAVDSVNVELADKTRPR